MQRPAKPCSPVRLRVVSPINISPMRGYFPYKKESWEGLFLNGIFFLSWFFPFTPTGFSLYWEPLFLIIILWISLSTSSYRHLQWQSLPISHLVLQSMDIWRRSSWQLSLPSWIVPSDQCSNFSLSHSISSLSASCLSWSMSLWFSSLRDLFQDFISIDSGQHSFLLLSSLSWVWYSVDDFLIKSRK